MPSERTQPASISRETHAERMRLRVSEGGRAVSGTVIRGSSAGQRHSAIESGPSSVLPFVGDPVRSIHSHDVDRPLKHGVAQRPLTAHRLAAAENSHHGGAKRVALTVCLVVLGLALIPTPLTAVARASASQAFVAEVNEARTSHSLRPLRVAKSLQRSSVAYSHWMLENQRFAHLAAIRAPRYFRLLGEVLARWAAKYPPVETIVRQWLASPSHRAVVLNPRYRFIGVGHAYGRLGTERGTLVTGHFGAR